MKEFKEYLRTEIHDMIEHSGGKLTSGNMKPLFYLSGIYKNLDTEDMEDEYIPITAAIAQKWVANMKNSDGTKGERWPIEKTTEVMRAKGIEHISEPLFYAVMNMLYSDYAKTVKKYGLDTSVDFWTDMTKAWIWDDDVRENKTSLYYEYVVKR